MQRRGINMKWTDILKVNPHWNAEKHWPEPSTWHHNIDTVLYIGQVFENLFSLGLGGESIWYYIGKPYKLTPEYTVLREAGLKLDTDGEGLWDWMGENGIYSIQDLEKWLKEGDEESE